MRKILSRTATLVPVCFLTFLLLAFALIGQAHAQTPPAPIGLVPLGAAYPHYTANVTLNWNHVAGATFYAIRAHDQTQTSARMPGNNCPGDPHYLCVNTVSSNSWSLAVSPGHYYDWWVHACNAYGCGPASSGVVVVEVAPPANLQTLCSPNGTSVTVSWSPVPGATGYAPRLNYVANDGPGCTDGWVCSSEDKYGEQASNSYTTNIVPNSPYAFWVHGIGPAGYGSAGATSFTCQPSAPQVSFPPFNTVRTDFINIYEGLWFSPMVIASPLCVYLPYPVWQEWLCTGTQSMPTTYPQTNAFSTAASNPYFSWIIAMNNEFIQNQDCNTGPPNQSRAVNQFGSPFNMTATAASLKLEVKHDASTTCLKIPYMSAAYLRGVQQGDSMTRLLSWSELQGKSLVLDVEITKQSAQVTWFRVLTHFRDPVTTTRYFINKDYVMPDTMGVFYMNWNWPWRNSFQYPGARIAIPARSPSLSLPNGRHTIVIPLASQWAEYFSASIQPDFLGVEVAVEIGELGQGISMDIKGISIQ